MNGKSIDKLKNLTDATIMHAFFVAINIIIVFYLINKGVITYPDSGGYIQNSPGRSPTYPLLLDLFEYIFDSDYLLKVVIFQIFLCLTSILIISLTIKKYFKLGWFVFYIIYFIFLAPIFSVSFSINEMLSPIYHFLLTQGRQNIANTILTEPLAYSLFLIAMSIAIVNIFKPKKV